MKLMLPYIFAIIAVVPATIFVIIGIVLLLKTEYSVQVCVRSGISLV